MKRFAAVLAVFFLLGCIIYGFVAIYSRWEANNRRIAQLERDVADASRLAKEESAAAAAANQRAAEAAAHAEVAARSREEAEQLRTEAEAGKQQAESVAKQANDQMMKARSELDAMRKQREEELNQMQRALSRIVETRRTENGMVMVLPDSVFKFDFDRADLSSHNRELLSRIAGILMVSKGYGLSVFGYTDDVGTKEYNLKLSERRAQAVRDYLVQAGIDPAIINTKGYGKSNPLVAGTTEAARARNRRVEIALTDSEIKYLGVAQP